MHQAIFSAREREIIKEYLETRTKTKGFRAIKHRVTRYMLPIIEDYNLMLKFYEETQTPTASTVDDKEDV